MPIEKKLQKGRDFCFQNERIATTGRMSQPAALKQEACRSRQCRGEGGAAAGSAATRGCLSGVISVAGRAAAGRCRGAQWVVSCVEHAKPPCVSGAERRASLLRGGAIPPRVPAGCASVPSARVRGQRAFIGRLLQASCVARYTLLYPIQRKKGSSCKTYLMALLALRTKPKSRIPIRLMRFFAPNIKSRRKTTLRRLRFLRKKCRQSPNTIGAGRG